MIRSLLKEKPKKSNNPSILFKPTKYLLVNRDTNEQEILLGRGMATNTGIRGIVRYQQLWTCQKPRLQETRRNAYFEHSRTLRLLCQGWA